jgi:hypothetical protein
MKKNHKKTLLAACVIVPNLIGLGDPANDCGLFATFTYIPGPGYYADASVADFHFGETSARYLSGTAIDWTAYNDYLENYCVWGFRYGSYDFDTGHGTGVSRSAQWSGVDYGRSIVNGCEGYVE